MFRDRARAPAHRLKSVSYVVPLAILLLAAGLRFYRLDLIEYKLDEANLSRMALDMVAGQGIPLRGISSSVGLANGPLSVWLLAIPYAFSRSPIVATGWVAALNVLAVAMTFALARRMSGARAAWVSALLFAVAPWAIINSRKVWAQDLLPPFVVGYLWTAYLALAKNKPAWLVLHGIMLSACVQLHYSALAFVPLTLAGVIGVWWKRWPGKIIMMTLIAGLASIAPFAHQMLRQGASAPLAQIAAIARPARAALRLDADAIRLAWLMTTGADLHSLAGPDEFRHFLASTVNLAPLFHLTGVLAAAGLVLALWPGTRHRGSQAREKVVTGYLVAAMLVFPILTFTAHATPVYPHYFILTFPAQFILAGLVIQELSGTKFLSILCASAVILIAAAQAYAFLSIQNFVGSRATPGGYGTPVGRLLRVVNAAEQRSQAMGNAEIIVAGTGDDVYADSEAAAFDVLLDPRAARRFVSMDSVAVYPAGRAVLVQRVLPSMSAASDFALRPGEGGYSLREWNGSINTKQFMQDRLYQPLTPPAAFANGVELLGYRVSGRAGQELRSSLAWQIQSAPAESVDYHWTNQLYDANGKRVWQKDGVGLPVSNWRAGDLVVTDFAAPLDAGVSPGAYTLRVGMYTYPDIQTVPTTDWQAYVKVGPIDIR